jgi:predicted nucleic acid-binding protein
VLIQAKEAHHITSVKEVLDAMLGAGFRITHVAYRNILRNAGERVR